MKIIKNILPILIVSGLVFSSCISVMPNAEFVPKISCDTNHGQLFLRIVNTGKLGISGLDLQTDSGEIKCGSLLPHETTCYFPIKSIYENPNYTVHLLRFNTFGETEQKFICRMIADNERDHKLTRGFYTLKIKLGRVDGDIGVHQFEIVFDRDKK